MLRKTGEVITVDTEADGPNPMKANVIGISFSGKVGSGAYLVTKRYDKDQKKLVDVYRKTFLDNLLNDVWDEFEKRKLVMHNAPYDVPILASNYGVDFTWCLHADTILLKHTLDEEHPFGLKDLAKRWSRHLGIPEDEIANQEQLELIESIKANGGKVTKEEYELYKADPYIIGKYAVADTDLTLRLYYYLMDRLRKAGREDFFFKKEVMPLMKFATLSMKMRGIMVDVPYFEAMQVELEAEAAAKEAEIREIWAAPLEKYELDTIAEKIGVKRKGDFALAGLEYYGIPVPRNKEGNPTLARAGLEKLAKVYSNHYLDWLLWDAKKSIGPEPQLEPEAIIEIQKIAYYKKDLDAAFQLTSNDDISWLIFDYYKENTETAKVSKKGKISVDKKALANYMHITGIKELLELRKIEKQLSTYIRPILNKHVDGWLYADMLQFGTTSGRYSCGGGLNLQTLPRDDKRIKKGFIAPPGYKIVSADFASLEPRIFSAVCNDPGLVAIFNKGEDFYSRIAIDTYGLDDLSAMEKDENFLKKKRPELRQATKGFALAVPYGANAYRLSMETGRSVKEHQEEIDKYLGAYPGLVDYMKTQEESAAKMGYVKTKFGRIRHLPKAKELYNTYGKDIFKRFQMALKFSGPEGAKLNEELKDIRAELKNPDFDFLADEPEDSILLQEYNALRKQEEKLKKRIEKLGEEGISLYGVFRNCMNNAKNSPIQMTAAHAANAGAIKFCSALLTEELDAWMCLQVHDEIVAIAREDQADRVAELLQDAMENNWVTRKIPLPILAEPAIGLNLAEVK